MPPYSKRYAGGFVDKPSLTTAIDATFLNAVEAALLALFGVAPATNGALVWNGTQFTAANKLTNANIDAAAGIAKSKLAALNIVDADVAGGAAIAKSKIALTGQITDADISAGAAIDFAKIDNGVITGLTRGVTPPAAPNNGDWWIYPIVATINLNWFFRYNSSSGSTYKWEFLFGLPAYSAVEADESANFNGSWGNLGTDGPSFTTPREGDWLVRWWTQGVSSSSADSFRVGVAVGNAAPTHWGEVNQESSSSAHKILTGNGIISGVPSGSSLKLRYQNNNAIAHFSKRHIEVLPVRVI